MVTLIDDDEELGERKRAKRVTPPQSIIESPIFLSVVIVSDLFTSVLLHG